MPRTRTIRVDDLSRVEGEGSLFVALKRGVPANIELRIFEPPRLFEGLLQSRTCTEVPDIVARICGICPVAYQMTAVRAIEKILGVEIEPEIQMLRRLLYLGEWIESHALHVFLLHAPDFLDVADVTEMARTCPERVKGGLALKKTGNDLVRLIGGREIHPVNVRIGGFYSAPRRSELRGLGDALKHARDLAADTVRWAGSFEFPEFTQDYVFVSLCSRSGYPVDEGRVISSQGLDIPVERYADYFVERQVAHSNALHSTMRSGSSYLVGPLARFNLNYEYLPGTVKELARELGLEGGCRNPFQSILVRSLEMVFACEEAVRLVEQYEEPPTDVHACQMCAGTGEACTEAPRGILYHRYELAADGSVVSARIIPPTSQNQKRIEEDLYTVAASAANLDDDALRQRCEQLIRSYDPCISCATHFLRLTVERT